MFNRIIMALILILGLVCSSLMLVVWNEKDTAALGRESNPPDSEGVLIEKVTNAKPDADLSDGNPSDENIGFSSEIIDLTNDAGQNYFVNYRIKREQFREETKEMLRLLLESDIRQTREEAQARWLELSHKISKEGEIENVLKMRGFKDVVSEVNKVKAVISVLAQELSLQEIYQIKSVAADITGFTLDRIEVTLRA